MQQSWDDLRIFLAVARDESLSAAGRRLKLDPATVGRRISRLEREFGAALFVRGPQGLSLTEAGTRLQEHAEDAEDAMAAAAASVDGSSDKLTGQIRIGAPDGCANYILPQVCAEIRKAHPDLEIQVLAAPRIFNLSKREADLSIMVSRPQTGRLTVQKIVDYHLHLAATEAMAQRVSSVDDLENLPVVGYIQDMIFDKELDYLAETGTESVQLASSSVAVQTMMLRAGAGVGIVHDFAMPFAPELRRVLVDDISLTRSFYLVRHATDRRSERLNRFIRLLVDAFRREVQRLEGLA